MAQLVARVLWEHEVARSNRVAPTRLESACMNCSIQIEQESDGRWLAEVPELPGVMAYGATPDEAMIKAETLALRVMADRLEKNETKAQSIHLTVAA